MARELTIRVFDRMLEITRGDQTERVNLKADSAPSQPSEALAEAIGEAIGGPTSAALLVPARWCYVHQLTLPQRRPSHETLRFAFEEFLPVDIEQLTCDFLPIGKTDYLAFGIEHAAFKPFLEQLAARGCDVRSISLALPAGDSDLVWCDRDHFVQTTRQGQQLKSIRVARLSCNGLPPQAAQLQRHLNGDLSGAGVTTIGGALEAPELTEIAEALSGVSIDQNQPEVPLPVNLCRGSLVSASAAQRRHEQLRNLLIGICLLLLPLIPALLIQRASLRGRLHALTDWQRDRYTEVFPNQSPPAGIARRVASERKRLEALTMSDSTTEARPALLHILRDVVASIPKRLNVNVQELRLDSTSVLVRGLVRDHGAAERIAQGIDALEGLSCPGPRTDRAKTGGVQFSLHAIPQPREP